MPEDIIIIPYRRICFVLELTRNPLSFPSHFSMGQGEQRSHLPEKPKREIKRAKISHLPPAWYRDKISQDKMLSCDFDIHSIYFEYGLHSIPQISTDYAPIPYRQNITRHIGHEAVVGSGYDNRWGMLRGFWDSSSLRGCMFAAWNGHSTTRDPEFVKHFDRRP